jgi:hypothetical protein
MNFMPNIQFVSYQRYQKLANETDPKKIIAFLSEELNVPEHRIEVDPEKQMSIIYRT